MCALIKVVLTYVPCVINEHQAVTGTAISDQTVRNRLREGGLRARRPIKVPRLTPAHRAGRRAYVRRYGRWRRPRWRQVLFTDESRYGLFQNDGRVRVYRRGG